MSIMPPSHPKVLNFPQGHGGPGEVFDMRWKVVSRATCECGGKVWLEWCTCAMCGKPAPTVEFKLRWRGKRYYITHDQDGNRLESLKHALAAQSRIEQQIKDNEFRPRGWIGGARNGLLFCNYAQEYLREQAERRDITPATLDARRWATGHFGKLADRNIREITPGAIQDWLAELGMSASSRRLIVNTLKQIFDRAVVRQDIRSAPPFSRIKGEDQGEIKYLTPAQQRLVLEQLTQPYQGLVAFLTETGCRVGEACGLCWDCVGPEGVVIKRTFGRYGLRERTKTGQVRFIPMGDLIRATLPPRGIGQTPVFAPVRGSHIMPRLVGVHWRKAVKAAGLDPIPLKNGTRHSMGTLLSNGGLTMDEVATILGHRNTQTTRQYYAKVEATRLAERVQKLRKAE